MELLVDSGYVYCFYASRRSRTRDTVKLTVCVCVCVCSSCNVPINAKPHPPPPGTGGDLSIWRCKGLTPGAILFDKPLANTPGHDSFTSTIYGLLAILTNSYDILTLQSSHPQG